ncbi:MAG: serine protease [Phycisphaerae bacterium]
MLAHTCLSCRTGVLALIALLTAGSPRVGADTVSEYQHLLKSRSDALVSVKFVLKRGDAEREMEIMGIVVDATGVVLCSSLQLGTSPLMQMTGGTATPTDVKVLIGDDTDGLEAKLVSRDSELDLAWIRIKEPGDRKFAFLDLAQSARPKPGERLLSLGRMSKYYDRAVVVTEGRMSGVTRKPREMYIPGAALEGEPGRPVFSASGELVGIVILSIPDPEDMDPVSLRRDAAALILPSAEVAKATQRALQNAEADESKSATTKP